MKWEFFVEGKPAPGGSKNFIPVWNKATGYPRMVKRGKLWWPIINVIDDAGDANKEWRRTVGWTARSFMMRSKPFPLPFHVHFVFYLKRPLHHYGTGRNANILKADAPAFHTQKPDALKLARSTEDALTGIVWLDDAQVVIQTAEKRWASREQKQGCTVHLTPLDREPTPEPAQQTLL
jgi:Holliday junction resolvase RusA-like endonuclease